MIWKFITYFVRKLNPETAHKISLLSLKIGFSPNLNLTVLPTTIKSINFSNPLGLAAGFDKNAELYKELSSFGFGFIEIGTVTPKPQSGNPKKRLFRLVEDTAIINRMGFNNVGVEEVVKNLKKNKTGALFVIERNNSLDFVRTSGDELYATISSPIIESIFYKNSPLHDGAVIIEGNYITGSRVILPVTDNQNINSRLGLRPVSYTHLTLPTSDLV